MSNPFQLPGADAPIGRRDALRIGGLAISLSALVAACGENLTGDTAPGRVGYAPPITDPPAYPVDDVVLLRTASSLELTIISAYRQMLALDAVDAGTSELLEAMIVNHQQIADQMGDLTETTGGEAWNCTNPWMMDRAIGPMLSTIVDSDDRARDIVNLAITLENLGASTHQDLSTALTGSELRTAVIEAATLESRQAATLAISVGGPDAYISPALAGEAGPVDAAGVDRPFAITHSFGSVGPSDVTLGAADDNGVRTSFGIQTPAANSFVYSELEPTC
jgi:hypothetical protein